MAPLVIHRAGSRGLFASATFAALLVPAVVAVAPVSAATETFSESFSGATLGESGDPEEARGWSDEPLERYVVGDGFRIRLRNSE